MEQHLYDILRRRAERHPAAIAVGAERGIAWQTLTSRDLLDRVDRLAAELADQGVREGDRVLLWAPNHWWTVAYLFAIWKLGAIVVPFDREMNPDAAVRILDSVEPRLTLLGHDERPAWSERKDAVVWWEPGSRVERAPAGDWQRPNEDLAAIFFTSGTTGNPKGCMIAQANLCFEVEALGHTIPLDTNSRLASVLPLTHLFELTVGLLYPLASGAAIHYVPSRRGPDIVRVLHDQKITHLIAVPQLLTLMGQALDDQLRARLPGPVYDRVMALAPRLPRGLRHKIFWPIHRRIGGSLRTMASGGAALPAETYRLWERIGVRVVEGYGTSECSPVVACGTDDGTTPVGSVGRPLRGVEVRLAADGELLTRGPNVMRGYWRDPERTAEVLRDGWYATGDLATIDAAGNVRLAGRAKDLIVLPSGLNVWPQDVEDTLRAQPGIRDAAVISVPTASGGARLHAWLIPADARTGSTDVAGLVAAANARLAQHQRIGSAAWWIESDFPRTSTLKVRRHLLPAPEAAAAVTVDAVRAADDPVAQAIAGIAKVPSVRSDQTLGDLGLDSLGLVELALALEEKTGKPVGDGDLRLDQTVAEIRTWLAGAPDAGEAAPGRRPAAGPPPIWPYTWGRVFRSAAWPVDLLYRTTITKTEVLGAEYLEDLRSPVIFAGTHHSFADMPLVRRALELSPARHFARRVVSATAAEGFTEQGLIAPVAALTLGLYPLSQHSNRDASLRDLARLAASGNAILIFPQGVHADPARERAGDPAVRFRPGVGLLAEALDATVVPFGLAGTENVIPPTRQPDRRGPVIGGIQFALTRGPLAIAFGPPTRLEPGESHARFATRLQAVCYALTRQAEAELG